MIKYGAIVPISYLNVVKGRSFHLCLAHLIKDCREYRNFYKEEASNGATIILDNSSIELGDSWCSPEELVEIYKSLENSNIFLMCPEEAYDGEMTAIKVRDFIWKIKDSNVKTFGTIHGKSYEEIVECYMRVEQLVDYVGFSYRIWCQDLAARFPNKTIERTLMRIKLLDKLLEDKVINFNKKHHLLGLNDSIELVSQSSHSFIHSCDSSTAFVHAKHNISFCERGLEGRERISEPIDFNEPWGGYFKDDMVRENIRRIDLYGQGKVRYE